jgi:adenosine deaminase
MVELGSVAKVDLHRHLEGAIRLRTLIELYGDAGAPLPEATPEELAPRAQVLEPMGSLEAVLARFTVAQGAFWSAEATERIAYEAVEDLAADNVRLAELRFSPEFLCEPHGLDWDEVMEAIVRGVRRASREHDVAIGLIAIASRNYGLASAQRTVAFALRHREDLVAFDLAGDERAFPPALYVDALAPLAGTGLGLTTHYGESGGPPFPREAIEALGSTRLGHGISVAWDPEVTALARDRGVTLEMCPTSNVRTRGVGSISDHPAPRLLEAGVSVTINTDNPGLFAIDLTHELDLCRGELGFSDDDLRRVTANALDASFVDGSVKRDVRRRHFGWVDGEPLGPAGRMAPRRRGPR